nr:MAG TPA: hypothetical protein [Caudoviricetes sp.]
MLHKDNFGEINLSTYRNIKDVSSNLTCLNKNF